MKTITLNNEKYVSELDHKSEIQQIKKQKGIKTVTNSKEIPFEIGGKYFIRTVTYFATGEVEDIKGDFLVLKDSAWIADTGRFREAIMSGVLNEVEPVEVPMFLNINSITDAFVWSHALPREQK
jgi:hypothetical protein